MPQQSSSLHPVLSYLDLLKVLIFLQIKAAKVEETIRPCLGQPPNAVQHGEVVRADKLCSIVKGDGR